MFKLLGVCLEVMFERIGHGIAVLLMYRTVLEFTKQTTFMLPIALVGGNAIKVRVRGKDIESIKGKKTKSVFKGSLFKKIACLRL